MTGQTISHYRILEKLGEGGMGIVFKAEDLKLKRTVAIKFLPRHLSVHGEERERFTQEAQAASALNHPNVATIYEIDEADGETFIVMEYVEGQTLREAKKDLAVRQVVDIGIQIAEGLAAAHEKGIVHRDVKAENIMLRKDGRVQVMDFGLAKLRGVSKLTKLGSTVGTMAYMSPEQVQGIETDHRTDIFSLGVLLYEILTGQLPFKGAHEAAVMYEIVNVHPQPVSALRQDVEAELERIIMKCLEKDREERYHSVKDVAVDLRHFRRDSEGRRIERKTPTPGSSTVPTLPEGSRRTRRPLYMIAAAVAIVGAAAAAWLLLSPAPEAPGNRVFVPLQVPFTTIFYPGLSADGNWIAFPATDGDNVTELYYMHVSGGEPKKLTNDSVWKYSADISPDGSQIVYTRGTSRQPRFPLQIWLISTLGGASKKLLDAGNGPRWSPDGSSIAYIGPPKTRGLRIGLWIVNADGSENRMLLEDSLAGRVSLAWSPGGKAIAWLRTWQGPTGNYQEIITIDLESKRERQITHEQKNIDELYWMPQGEILFSSNRQGPSNLWSIPAEGGTPVQVTVGPGPDLAIKASRDGKRVLYMQQSSFGAVMIADPDGRNARQITPDDQSVTFPRFSPDGKTLAFRVNDPDPIKSFNAIYLVDADGRNRRRLTSEKINIENFVWSADGRKLAYTVHLNAETDSAHRVEIIDVVSPSQKADMGKGRVLQWLPDNAALNISNGTGSWRVPVQGGAPELLDKDSSFVLYSQDWRNVCLIKVRQGTVTLSVKLQNRPLKVLYEGPIDREAVFQWHPSGKSIVLSRGGELRTLSVETGKLERYPWNTREAAGFDDISPDGKRTAYVKNRMNAKLIMIENFH